MNTQTNFASKQFETDKNDKTVEISNNDFLSAIFNDNPSNKHPIIVSFKGNPETAAKGKWFGHPWSANSAITLSDDANNYFSLARFKPNDTGEYRRLKLQFYSLHAVMLDDIGTKVLTERVTLLPSWLLETSPGNFQAGYILSEPITSSKAADQLMSAIISAGLCDRGANGPATRLARLPVAINGKHSPDFSCQLKTWQPKKRYSMEELINGLQLEIVEIRSKRTSNPANESHDEDSEQIWTPRPEENAVIAMLRKHNLYKLPLGECKHDITCPWVEDHTNCIDGGTAYFEPDDNYPIGGFKCLHGHCSDRRIRDLLRFLDVDLKSARMKPTIRVIKGEIHRIVEMAERELAVGQQFYQRGGIIVFVYTDPSTHETLIQNITQPALVRALSGIATWEQFDSRSKKMVRIDPPARHASILFDSSTYRHLPILNGIARQPYLRPNGTLMQESGYDTTTGMFGAFDSRKFSIPDNPTRENAHSALNLINNLLE